MRKVNKIVIHCSASSIVGQRIAHIKAWHTKPVEDGGRGWKDVGYHYFIGFDGRLEEGRDLDVTGAHAEGHNSDSVGVCLAGLQKKDFQTHQIDVLKTLLKILKRLYPTATLHPHHEFNKDKTCPVFDIRPIQDYWNKL